MMKEPRVFKQSSFAIFFILIVFIFILGVFFFVMNTSDSLFLIPFLGIFVIMFLVITISLFSKVTISDDEISSQGILGAKTLKWTEIHRVSGRGTMIRLHNFDEDITVSIGSRMPGFQEIVEIIGEKRVDLFKPNEHQEMSRSWLYMLSFIISGGTLIAAAGFVYFTVDTLDWFTPLIVALVGLFIIVSGLFAPQSVSLQDDELQVKYLFSQKMIQKKEISAIHLSYTQGRNGRKNYFIQINYSGNKSIRLNGLNPSLPVAYLVLKNWHKK
jgi:hypothetical protein